MPPTSSSPSRAPKCAPTIPRTSVIPSGFLGGRGAQAEERIVDLAAARLRELVQNVDAARDHVKRHAPAAVVPEIIDPDLLDVARRHEVPASVTGKLTR